MKREMRNHSANEKGFSILEGLIAISIFGIGLLSVIVMLDVGFNAGSSSRNRTTATQFAATMVDRIRFETTEQFDDLAKEEGKTQSYNNMDTNNPPPAIAPASFAFAAWQQDIQRDLPNGLGRVLIQTIPGMPLHRRVRVNVSWTDVGIPRSVELETRIAYSL